MSSLLRVFALLLVVASLGCRGEAPVCRSGESIACTGVGGCEGFQACRDDGSRFDPCVCEASADGWVEEDGSVGRDAGVGGDAHVGVDAAAEMDGGSRDAGRASESDAGSDGRPYVSCGSRATRWPEPFTVMASVFVPDNDVVTAVRWRLASAPPGSSIAFTSPSSFTDPSSFSFPFTPDVAGDYEFCITIDAGGLTSPEACCTYSSAADFRWSFAAERSTRYVEEVEMLGRLTFSFDINQGFEIVSGDYASSDPAWSVSEIHPRRAGLQMTFTSPVDGLPDAVSAGDEVTLVLRGNPILTGPEDSVVRGTVSLASAPDPGAHTPLILDIETSSLIAGRDATISVRFDTSRPVGQYVSVGGWGCPPSGSELVDDGTGDDLVAGDGRYTGRFRVPDTSGVYDILVQGHSGESYRDTGPYFRTTISVP